jgi:hypothetical protein
VPLQELRVPPRQEQEIKSVEASMRLDAIASAGEGAHGEGAAGPRASRALPAAVYAARSGVGATGGVCSLHCQGWRGTA